MTSASLNRGTWYVPDISADQRRVVAVRWLTLAVWALMTAGVFSVLLVLSRTPFLGDLLPHADFFRTALVIHVNLSVLVWTLAFAGCLWTLVGRAGPAWLHNTTLIIVSFAMLLLIVSAFLPDAQPVMANYVPVIDHPLFIGGLLLLAIGAGTLALTAMWTIPPAGRTITAAGVMRFGLNCAAVSVIIALLAFAWSWFAVPRHLVSESYYELLAWGGGHVLQYSYLLLMMVCWLWLTSLAGIRQYMSERVMLLVFMAGLVSVFIAPLIYYAYPVTDPMHKQLFTWLMSFGGSLATLPLGLALYLALMRYRPAAPAARTAHTALMTSLLLFGAGGLIGFMIRGSDVTVPAHYHGCIVGITIALMGVGYDLLPRLGHHAANPSLARLQLWTYALGQFLHIIGLVWSGGYGVARKVAGTEQGLEGFSQVAGMGLMGIGGLASAIGGFLFIVLVLRALSGGHCRHGQTD